ncbi:MAG: amidophosphoribosyltransferase [bacterium (Candidatus Ratteibacteria) CG_4_10_14_3_um_filter_41_18]|uniref:Amidophosphoribosyltransferase n=2 Tax=Candidatus Ratteibacteria TaxID=2979319 RepID=A0A2M7YE29_9BACT|nr:MAG: amidophosphoribosyltransferase [bacterium (Candidatus Ratteibacteria) CG_4_10_14_3_um_filter_41_18]PJA61213.1 MAG: amidophosphoribosyltransferase [bacterium (Candidatus Ratteibacteria) CG_4_9_14_3_um_filter_41_21]HCG76796.1 amidophosphoribosyltransferase [bacterium]
MCGIFGVYGHPGASELAYLGLYSLQHRGQESAGIVTSNGRKLCSRKGMGLISDVFTNQSLNKLKGYAAIGHVRYSTTGSSLLKNAQPFLANYPEGEIAIAHNGNLTNSKELRDSLQDRGSIFQTTTDSEVIIHLMACTSKKSLKDRLIDALLQIKGAYSLLLITEKEIVAARDPNGFRPLCLGKLDNSFVVASESCAFDIVQAEYIREIEPGEILIINEKGLTSLRPFPKVQRSLCIFEFIYFARPDSKIFGKSVYLTRKRLGEKLYGESPVKSDLIIPIPDSGNYAALGFAQKSKINFELGIIRNHYIGRTFIQPKQEIRDLDVKIKLNPVKELLKGKRITVVEDSIVRGTTSRLRMQSLRQSGAKRIDMRVSCPPHRFPCFYGIDFSTRGELIASSHSIEETRKFIGLDSLSYLSLEGMLDAMPLPRENFCVACFNGKYPIPIHQKISKYSLE